MKTFHCHHLFRLLATLALTQFSATAAPFDWTGTGPDLFWSTPANWSPLGPPVANSEARFFDAGAVGDATTINSIVATSQSIERLWVGPVTGTSGGAPMVHNIQINAGATLTIAGTNHNGYGNLGSGAEGSTLDPNVLSTIYIGTKTNVGATTTVTNTISGAGRLVVQNTNNEINVRQIISGTTGGTEHWAVFDLSGLDTFIANLARIRVGDGESEPIRRASGIMALAKTNQITLTGTNVAENVQLLVGNNDVNNNGNRISDLLLGQVNFLNTDEILIGARKTIGRMRFNPLFTDSTLTLRGSGGGTNRVKKLRIGDHSDQLNTGNATTGTIDLGAGTVDALVDTVYVGRSSGQQTGPATGTLTLGAGTFDANTVEVAYQTTEQNTTSTATGTWNVNGTTVVIHDLLRLGRSAGATAARTATLNLTAGSIQVLGSYRNEGTVTLNITSGVLALPTNAVVVANTVTVSGGAISNAATLRVTNLLTLLNDGVITGNPVFDLGNSGTAVWDILGAPGGSLLVSNALVGSGFILGDIIQASTGLISPGGNGTAGVLAIQSQLGGGNLTLNGGALRFDLSSSASGVNDQLQVAGTLTANQTNEVQLTALGGIFDTTAPYTLINSGTLVGDATRFRVGGGLAQSRYTFSFDTAIPNTVRLSVGGTGPAQLSWRGDSLSNLWDLKGSSNWNRGLLPDQFYSLDSVTFSDLGSTVPPIQLVGHLNPGALVVSNLANPYVFSGTGGLTGASLEKAGSGALTFTNQGNLTFSAPVTIDGGDVIIANSGQNSFSGGLSITNGRVVFGGAGGNAFGESSGIFIGQSGSLIMTNSELNTFGGGPVQLDGRFTIGQPVDATLDGSFAGAGSFFKTGIGTVTLSGANSSLSGQVRILGGTLRAGSIDAFGTAEVTVAPGGALDVNGRNLAALPLVVGGAGPDGRGALVNRGGPQPNAVGNVTLSTNTTFGGSGPWKTDPVLNTGLWGIQGGLLSTSNQPYSLTKAGLNQVSLINAVVDPALADIDVQEGMLSFEGATDSMGNPNSTLTVRAGATLSFFNASTTFDKRLVLHGDGVNPTLHNWTGANALQGPVELHGNVVMTAPPPDRGSPISLGLNGTISGSGGITKPSADLLILAGTNTYTGPTVISAGILVLVGNGSIGASSNVALQGGGIDASGRNDNTLTVASGQTLLGRGQITGNLTAVAGSTVSPGQGVGTLLVSGNVNLQGTTVVELDKANGTNDLLESAGQVTFSGTLVLNQVGGALAATDTFKIFQGTGYSGSFASIQPSTPGAGLAWDTSTLATDGTLRLTGGSIPPHIDTVRVSGGNLILSGSGGVPLANYVVISSTNILLPIASWSPVSTQQYNAQGSFSVTNAVDSGTNRRFFTIRQP